MQVNWITLLILLPSNILPGKKPAAWHSLGRYFDTCHPPKHFRRPVGPAHGNTNWLVSSGCRRNCSERASKDTTKRIHLALKLSRYQSDESVESKPNPQRPHNTSLSPTRLKESVANIQVPDTPRNPQMFFVSILSGQSSLHKEHLLTIRLVVIIL